jgi:hypothetical protein
MFNAIDRAVGEDLMFFHENYYMIGIKELK